MMIQRQQHIYNFLDKACFGNLRFEHFQRSKYLLTSGEECVFIIRTASSVLSDEKDVIS